MQKLLFLAVLLLIPWPSQAQNNSPSVPDLNGWKFTVRPLEVKIYGQVTAYFGFDVFCQNPKDANEFARVLIKTTTSVFKKIDARNSRSDEDASAARMAKQSFEDYINRGINKADPIVIISWKVGKDVKTGQPKLQDKQSVWIWHQGLAWFYFSGEKVTSRIVSDFINSKLGYVPVGIEYSVGSYQNIVRANPGDVLGALLKGSK